MTMIKMLGCGSVKTAERRKLRRLGRIANRLLQRTGVYTHVRITRLINHEALYDPEGDRSSLDHGWSASYSIQGGWWENWPYVRDSHFDWKKIRRELVPAPRVTQEECDGDDWVEVQEDQTS